VSLLTVPIVDIVAVTPRSRLLCLDLHGHRFRFDPGQAVMTAPSGRPERRPYSIACSPEHARESNRLELLIALEHQSDTDLHLSNAAEDDLIDIEGPFGDFVFPATLPHERVLFVAGGTGIAPLRAMFDHALRLPAPPRMALLYSARRSDEFAFIDELRTHARNGHIELHQTVTRDQSVDWEGSRGRIGRAHFESVLPEPQRTLCFVCGPPLLVTESVGTLSALGVPDTLIRTEQWGR
jgi:NAD(P)H-flavin reductase